MSYYGTEYHNPADDHEEPDYILAIQKHDAEWKATMPCLEPLKALAAATNIQAVFFCLDTLTDYAEDFNSELLFASWPELDQAHEENNAKMKVVRDARKASSFLASIVIASLAAVQVAS